jgi:hypothetical protein
MSLHRNTDALCQKRAFCSSVLVSAIVAWTWAAREKRFGFPDVGAIVAGRDQIFPNAANLTCRTLGETSVAQVFQSIKHHRS